MARFSLLTAAALLTSAAGCGFTTHQVIAHRARSYLYDDPFHPSIKELVDEDIGALECGSTYPDYLYECGSDHDNGEFAHWSPFQAAAATYIQAHYPLPWNSSAATLVAFMTGVTSHYIADITWHGLAETPSAYGLIETIGALDFNSTGDLDSAPHSLADTGGEFTAAYQTDLTFLSPTSWALPINDILGIYASANRTNIAPGDLEECAAIFFAGSEAIKTFAALAEPMEIAPSPTFGEQYVDMPCGGVDDMATWSGRMWQRWGDWVLEGPPNPVPGNEYNTATAASAPARHQRGDLYRRIARLLGPALLQRGLVRVDRSAPFATRIERSVDAGRAGAASRIDALLTELRRMLDGRPAGKHAWKAAAKAGWTVPRAAETAPAAVAAALADLLRAAGAGHVLSALQREARTELGASASADSVLIAAVKRTLDFAEASFGAATGERAAAALPAAPAALGNGTVEGSPMAIWASATPLEWAGAALATGDFDGDGLDDLVATAYGHSAWGEYSGGPGPATLLPQSGGFYTRYGNVTGSAADGTVATPDPEPLPAETAVFGATEFTRLGWATCTLDFNGDGTDDLAVSAPTEGWNWGGLPIYDSPPVFIYTGAVHVFFGQKGRGLASNTPDVTILAAANNTHMGQHLNCLDVSGDGKLDLLVGSYFAQVNYTSLGSHASAQIGRADVFFSSPAWSKARAAAGAGPAVVSITAANVSFTGGFQYEWLGFSSAAVSNATAVEAELGLTHAEVAQAVMRGRGYAAAEAVPSVCQPLAAAALRTGARSLRKRSGKAVAPAAADPAPVTGAGATLLLLGSPGYRSSTLAAGFTSVGRLSAFPVPLPGTPAAALAACLDAHAAAQGAAQQLQAAPLFTVTADTSIMLGPTISTKLGAGVAVGKPLGPSGSTFFAVGVPSVDFCNSTALAANSSDVFSSSAGAVAVVPLTAALRGDIAWTALTAPGSRFATRVTLKSSMPDSRFGYRLAFADATGDGIDDLLVAAPLTTPVFLGAAAAPAIASDSPALKGVPVKDLTNGGREAGAVLLYRGGVGSFPAGSMCGAETAAAWRADGPVEHGRLGSSWTLADVNGDGVRELILGAPRAAVEIPPERRLEGAAAARAQAARALQTEGTAEYAGAVLAYAVQL